MSENDRLAPHEVVDTVITGGSLVTPDATFRADIAISEARIAAVGSADVMPKAHKVISAEGLFVLPGALDVHVHFREPGFAHKETWLTGTQAAAAGGVTTVFDMPNTNPAICTARTVEEKIAIAQPQAIVDFGVYGLIHEERLDEIEPMVEAGAMSFKLYMGSENPLVPCPSDGAIVEAFELLAELGLRCSVHAENTSLLRWRGRKLQASGRTDGAAHLEQHVDLAEVEAVKRTALFSRWTGCKVHIVHVSSRHSLPAIIRAKADGVDLTAETCPHYLYISTADGARLGDNFLRVKPPVREPGHAEPLWAALTEGVIDIISTDHAPHLPEEKRRASIWDCAPGFPGVETSMRLMLTGVNSGKLSLNDYVRLSAEAPAKAFGLFPRKGSLLPGTDADIVLVDLQREEEVHGADLHSIGNATPYEGFITRGLPVMTLVRGQVVMDQGKIVGRPGWGQSLRPEQ